MFYHVLCWLMFLVVNVGLRSEGPTDSGAVDRQPPGGGVELVLSVVPERLEGMNSCDMLWHCFLPDTSRSGNDRAWLTVPFDNPSAAVVCDVSACPNIFWAKSWAGHSRASRDASGDTAGLGVGVCTRHSCHLERTSDMQQDTTRTSFMRPCGRDHCQLAREAEAWDAGSWVMFH